jgi:hypothetical protein
MYDIKLGLDSGRSSKDLYESLKVKIQQFEEDKRKKYIRADE